MKQLQAYVEGAWRDVAMIDYARGFVVVWGLITDSYGIEDVELRLKEEWKWQSQYNYTMVEKE